MNPTFFYIAPDGARYGPVTKDELNQWFIQGRIFETAILEEASTGKRLSYAELIPSRPAPAAMRNPYETPRSPADYPRYQPAYGEVVPNHLAKAIISALVCGCLPLGIVAIVHAAQVDGVARSGDIARARDLSRKADLWANWSFAVGIGWGILWVLFEVLVVGLTHLH
ncbi:MAG TPA: CD225/dispanin family protein [Fimbriimonas sp.]|nr:CD225/dispanin family protein [Fimbriimonas sp.]